MTNCNYSEHTKIQRKEIQKQIEELQEQLKALEAQQEPQMTLDKSGDIDVVFYKHRSYYRMGFASTGRSWWMRGVGNPSALILVDDPETLVKLEQLYEDMILDTGGVEEPEQGTWNYDPDAKFVRKQEEVNTLQEKDWKVDVKTNLKSHWEPTPQEPEEVEGLKEAFRESVKQGVVSSSTKPQTLYEICMDWWRELYSTADMNISIEKLVNRIEKEWLPTANEDFVATLWSIGWKDGFNAYRIRLMEKLK